MAKKRKPGAKPPAVSLPPFPWATTARLPGGAAAPLARPDVVADEVVEAHRATADSDVIVRRARIWRTQLPPMMRALSPAPRAALLDYAEAVEAVAAPSGASSFAGARGGGAPRPGAAPHGLLAADRLRRMDAAIGSGGAVMFHRTGDRRRPAIQLARIPYRDLAIWVAVDGLSRAEILRRAGAPASSEEARDALLIGLADLGERLAVCCGYITAPRSG